MSAAAQTQLRELKSDSTGYEQCIKLPSQEYTSKRVQNKATVQKVAVETFLQTQLLPVYNQFELFPRKFLGVPFKEHPKFES